MSTIEELEKSREELKALKLKREQELAKEFEERLKGCEEQIAQEMEKIKQQLEESARKRKEEAEKAEAKKEKKQGAVQLYIEMNSGLLKRIFDTIRLNIGLGKKNNPTECKFVFSEDAISCKVVDPGHVALLDIKMRTKDLLTEGNFRRYETMKEDLEIGFDVRKMTNLLKMTRGAIVLEQFTGEEDYVYLSWDWLGKHVRKIRVRDAAGIPDSKVPHIDLPASFYVKTDGMLNFLREAQAISDHITITADKSGVEFEASDDEDMLIFKPDDPRVSLPPDRCDDAFRSLYSIDYLRNMTMSMKLFHDILKLYIGNDNPIYIGGIGTIEMNGMIAPRVESE